MLVGFGRFWQVLTSFGTSAGVVGFMSPIILKLVWRYAVPFDEDQSLSVPWETPKLGSGRVLLNIAKQPSCSIQPGVANQVVGTNPTVSQSVSQFNCSAISSCARGAGAVRPPDRPQVGFGRFW